MTAETQQKKAAMHGRGRGSLLLAVLLLTGAAGCGKKADPAASPASASQSGASGTSPRAPVLSPQEQAGVDETLRRLHSGKK